MARLCTSEGCWGRARRLQKTKFRWLVELQETNGLFYYLEEAPPQKRVRTGVLERSLVVGQLDLVADPADGCLRADDLAFAKGICHGKNVT